MISIRKTDFKLLFGLCLIFVGISSLVLASNNPNFQLMISPGTLAIDVVDQANNYQPVSTPVFKFSSISASTECTSGANSPTLVLGSNVNNCGNEVGCDGGVPFNAYLDGGNLYIQNPDASSDGFTVSLAATGGKNAFWTDQNGKNSLDYNNSDCLNDSTKMQYVEANGPVLGGRMYVDPSVAIIQNGKCTGSCSTSGLSLGSANSFQYNSVDSITLLQANASADNIADYIINGVNVSQTIPAMTPSSNYSLDMTMSIISSGNSGATALRSSLPVTYNGNNVAASDIYVAPDASVDLSASISNVSWSITDNGYYAAALPFSPPYVSNTSGQITTVYNNNYNTPTNVSITASEEVKGTPRVSDINIHFGTGKDCGRGVWTSNSSNCYADQTSCQSAGYTWDINSSSCYSGSYCSWFPC